MKLQLKKKWWRFFIRLRSFLVIFRFRAKNNNKKNNNNNNNKHCGNIQ